MALLGAFPKPKALAPAAAPAEPPGAAAAPDPELTGAIRAFQGWFGLRPDGIMRPGGETQRAAAPLVEAKTALELGGDPARPRPFRPRPNPPIVRSHPDRPTRMSVPFGSGIGLDDDDTDHRLALDHARDMTEADRAVDETSNAADGRAADRPAEQGQVPETEEIRRRLHDRYGGGDARQPWRRGEAESSDAYFQRLRSALHHAPDSGMRAALVEAARRSLPSDPVERLAAEQGVKADAWLSADEAPDDAQKTYREWLDTRADRRPPLPDLFEGLYFAGPDGVLYLRDGAAADPGAISDIRRVEALAQERVRREGGPAPDYVDLFRAAAEAQMGSRQNMPRPLRDPGGTLAPAPALGRRSRLERFHRHGPAIPENAPGTMRIDRATAWIESTMRRLKQRPGHTRNEGVQVGRMTGDVAAFVRRKGFEPGNGTILLSDSVVQHMLREAKRAAGKALPEAEVARLPRHLHKPRAVLWEKRADGRPTLAYVFDVPGDARRGKFVVRVALDRKLKGRRQTFNGVVTGGLAELHNLKDARSYTPIVGDLE